MSVVHFVELSGRSSESFEDAVRQTVERASRTIRNIQSVWVKEFEGVVENNRVTQFQVVVKLSFLLGEGAGADQVNSAIEGRMAQTRGPSINPQRGSGASQGKGTAEGVVGQAAEAVHNVAESASRLARDTYETGARYVREGLNRYPEAGRYLSEGGRAVSRPVEQHPVLAILAAGAVGYLLAYLIHGGRFQSLRESVPDYARTREYSRHRP
jgi:dodecin